MLAICPAVLDRHILPLDVAGFAQASVEGGYAGGECCSRSAVEETNHRNRRLLRGRRERPRCETAEKSEELAPPHGGLPQGQGSQIKYSRPSPCIAAKVGR